MTFLMYGFKLNFVHQIIEKCSLNIIPKNSKIVKIFIAIAFEKLCFIRKIKVAQK